MKEVRETRTVGGRERGRVGGKDTDIIHHVGRKRKRRAGRHRKRIRDKGKSGAKGEGGRVVVAST